MSVLSGTISGNSVPANVASGDYTLTASSTFDAGGVVLPIDLSSSGITASGRYVIVRAGLPIANYVGATVTPPPGLSLYGVSLERVSYSGLAYYCIVVALK